MGFHPHDHPFVKDGWEEYLLQHGYLKCISILTSEFQYDQLNLEILHLSILR